MLVTVIVTGILAAITTPSLVGLINRNQVKEAQRQVASALKEAQRQAMRRGKSCQVTINPTAKTISANPSQCLSNNLTVGTNTLIGGDQVLITANDGNANIISFTHKGTTDIQKTIVVYSSLSNEKKCIVIADTLGTVRTGNYDGDVSATVIADSCKTAD
jgi:type II secretory pathway pseudopilin PulG